VTVQAEGADVQKTGLVTVIVTFPASPKSPYRAEVTPDTTIGSVRIAAMNYFEVTDSAGSTFVLTHDGKVESDSDTIAEVAGEREHTVEFRLVKRITQG
jgi:hypothetical protein